MTRMMTVTALTMLDDDVAMQVFGGMKIIKLYAWEMSFRDKVKGVRDEELRLLREYMLTNIGAHHP
jgi:hypothetical protein